MSRYEKTGVTAPRERTRRPARDTKEPIDELTLTDEKHRCWYAGLGDGARGIFRFVRALSRRALVFIVHWSFRIATSRLGVFTFRVLLCD